MGQRVHYSFLVARYSPDISNGERFNLGILFHADGGTVQLKIADIGEKMKGFCDVSDLKYVERVLDALYRKVVGIDIVTMFGENALLKAVHSVYPLDDSSLRIEEGGQGMTSDTGKTFMDISKKFLGIIKGDIK